LTRARTAAQILVRERAGAEGAGGERGGRRGRVPAQPAGFGGDWRGAVRGQRAQRDGPRARLAGARARRGARGRVLSAGFPRVVRAGGARGCLLNARLHGPQPCPERETKHNAHGDGICLARPLLTLRRRYQGVSACARLVADACGKELSERHAKGCAGRPCANAGCAPCAACAMSGSRGKSLFRTAAPAMGALEERLARA